MQRKIRREKEGGGGSGGKPREKYHKNIMKHRAKGLDKRGLCQEFLRIPFWYIIKIFGEKMTHGFTRANLARIALAEYIRRTRALIMCTAYQARSKKKAQCFTRNRKMNFPCAMHFMLNMVKESVQLALERYFDKLGSDVHMTQQAFSKLRANIASSALRELFCTTVQVAYEGHYDTWQGQSSFPMHCHEFARREAPTPRRLLLV